MDLNPQPPIDWSDSGEPFEIADYCQSIQGKSQTNVLVLLNAWLDSKEDVHSKWDTSTLNYWIKRLRPLWDAKRERDRSGKKEEGGETLVVICNRCGSDNGELTLV